jgi:hypothetical protein
MQEKLNLVRDLSIPNASHLGMASTAISGLGFLLATSLVGALLGSESQSRYFMVMSLLALQSAFDLGASQILMTNIAFRRREFDSKQRMSDEVAGFLRLSMRYSMVCSGFYFLTLAISFLIPFKISVSTILEGCILSLASSGCMFVTFICSFLEGLGDVDKSFTTRFLVNVSRTLVLLISLLCGAEVYAITISIFVSAVVGILALVRVGDLPLLWRVGSVRNQTGKGDKYTWRKYILPSQWRSAISWVSAYVIYQGPIWVVFANLDSRQAARFSLSWNVFMGLSSFTSVILSTSVASISNLMGTREIDRALRIWKQKSINLVAVSTLTGLICVTVVAILPQNLLVCKMVLDWFELCWLLVGTIANQVIYCFVIIGRARGKEPFHFHYLCWVLMVSGFYVIAKDFLMSSLAIVLVYTTSSLFMVPLFLKTGKNESSK